MVHDEPVRTLLPAVDLTPATTERLDRLQLIPQWGRRGVNRIRLTPVRGWTTPLDSAEVAAHLGVPVPRIPTLDRRGCTTSVRAFGKQAVLDHPVPRATAPPPGRGAQDLHSLLVVFAPPGIDPGELVLEGGRPAGAGWVRIAWGRSLAEPGDPGDDDPQMQAWMEARAVSWTTVRSPGSPPVHVLRHEEERTSASWLALAAGSLFSVEFVLPFAPLPAVQALAEAAAAARVD